MPIWCLFITSLIRYEILILCIHSENISISFRKQFLLTQYLLSFRIVILAYSLVFFDSNDQKIRTSDSYLLLFILLLGPVHNSEHSPPVSILDHSRVCISLFRCTFSFSPHKIALFSRHKFVALLVATTVYLQLMWYAFVKVGSTQGMIEVPGVLLPRKTGGHGRNRALSRSFPRRIRKGNERGLLRYELLGTE